MASNHEQELSSTADVDSATISLAPDSQLRNSILLQLYVAHALSAWTSRAFEFGATLFLAAKFPHTLLPVSAYALLRSLAASLLSSRLGAWMDSADRLTVVRRALVAQRGAIAGSCALFAAMMTTPADAPARDAALFAAAVVLAAVERLASMAGTVAVERDWAVAVAAELCVPRGALNAVLRRVDLLAKLLAPVAVSLAEGGSRPGAALLVLAGAVGSAPAEWVIAGRVYRAVGGLRRGAGEERPREEGGGGGGGGTLRTWRAYCGSDVFLPSFSLALLYLTVLSTGVQFQAFMLAGGYSPVSVSLLRLAAVLSELSATCFAPHLIRRIGVIRAGLWSINWQVVSLVIGVLGFVGLASEHRVEAGAALTAGIVLSRLGLWGFDLAVQDIVQEVCRLLT